MVSMGTELCEHDLHRCRMMCLWFPQVQALCKTLFMYYICINVLCIVMQCSASTQLCHFFIPQAQKCVPSEHGIVYLPQTWNVCSVLSLQEP